MKKVLVILLALVIISTCFLVACEKEVIYVYQQIGGSDVEGGNGGGSGGTGTIFTDDGSTYNLTVWCAEADEDMIWKMLDKYKSLHNVNNYNFKVETVGEDVVSSSVTKDVGAAGDVFSFANDQLGNLLNQSALYPIPNVYKPQIEDQIDVALTSCKSGGNYYAIPYSYENCFMYYNKSLVSEEDVRSMETLLEKSVSGVEANLAIDMSDSYYTTMFLYTAGVEIFGPQGNDPNSVDFANDNAIKACEYIAWLGKQDKFKSISKADQFAALKNGTIAAMVSGPHMIKQFKEALGENFGVAMLPTIKLNGETKQLVSFSGVKMYGISNKTNSVRDAKHTAEACRLAAFLANSDNQQTRLTEREFCPTDYGLFDAANGSGLRTVEVVVNQSKYSNLKPGISEMKNYWDTMGPVLLRVFTQKTNRDSWLKELEGVETKIKPA